MEKQSHAYLRLQSIPNFLQGRLLNAYQKKKKET